MVLCIELLSFLLENLTTDIFVLGDTIRIESSAASLTALNILRGIILSNLHSILTVDLLNTLFLNRVTLPGRLPHLLLFGLHLPLWFLIINLLFLIIVLLILLRIFLRFIIIILVSWFRLLVDILIGVCVIVVSIVVLCGLRIIIRILILVTSKIYML